MSKVRLDISMSLDGYVAGPDADMENPLGVGGMQLHEWVFGLDSWRRTHGQEGGATNVDDEVVQEGLRAQGAVVMGRKMFSGGSGPWEQDANAEGWWGEEPPFDVPVFVLTQHAREPKPMPGGNSFTFVTDGIDAALTQARATAREKDVLVAGGADVAQQYLTAGLLDEVQVHIAPLFLGSGVRLFDNLGADVKVEPVRVIESPNVTHVRYRVVRN
jgi:dihydrofolate reductase